MRLELSHKLSSWLKGALVAFAVTFGLALVDSIGQTVYALAVDPHTWLGARLAGAFAGLAAFAAGARKLAVRFGGDAGSDRPRLPLKVVATAAAAVVMTVTLSSANAFSHGLLWGFTYPHDVPTELWRVSDECPAAPRPCRDPAKLAQVACPDECLKSGELAWEEAFVHLFLLVVLSLLFGRSCRFLNDSTLQPLYRARLIRAYLGASNPRRLDPDCPKPVTKMLADDDVALDWADPQSEFAESHPTKKYAKGAPLHIVNVTVNETVEKKTGLQRSDRRGIGMAVGPAGISAGIRHHVVFSAAKDGNLPARVFPEHPCGGRAFRMFDYRENAAGQTGAGAKVLYRGGGRYRHARQRQGQPPRRQHRLGHLLILRSAPTQP